MDNKQTKDQPKQQQQQQERHNQTQNIRIYGLSEVKQKVPFMGEGKRKVQQENTTPALGFIESHQ